MADEGVHAWRKVSAGPVGVRMRSGGPAPHATDEDAPRTGSLEECPDCGLQYGSEASRQGHDHATHRAGEAVEAP
jgi:hypothetical protein